MTEFTSPLSTEGKLSEEFVSRASESSALAFRVAVSVLRHTEDAEDIAQEALCKAWCNLVRLRDPDRFRAWLYRIAWTLAINRNRENGRWTVRARTTLVKTSRSPTAIEALLEQERSERLHRSIAKLPEKIRVVTVLAVIEEHSIRETATLLRLPEGTVKKRLFLARRRLKQLT